jgi:hypothetical protein
MARRIAARTPDRVPGAAAVHLCAGEDHGRLAGWQRLADGDTGWGGGLRRRGKKFHRWHPRSTVWIT